MRYAGILLLAVSTGMAAYHLGHRSKPIPGDQNFEIVVPRGGRSSVILPDGSSIWMNSGSFLRYSNRFDQETREVYLEGEALFEVEKGDHPFIVHTTHLDIFVHGTTFNVKSYPAENQVEATLIEGEIRVETRGTKESATIKPHQKIRYHKDLNIAEIISAEKIKTVPQKDEVIVAKNLVILNDVDIEETVSWQSGTLIINNETLESLVQKLERKWDVTFVFENEDLKHQSYSGTIPDFPIEQVLNAIALTSPVDYTIHEKTVYLRFNKEFEMKKN
jgi:ferric-dicitrate binding protein FerR (iron transport regulator)